MKIRFWDRVILFCGALLTVAAGILLMVAGLQFAGWFGAAMTTGWRVVCIVGGVLLVALGAYLFLLPKNLGGGKHDFIVQQTDNGELRISVKAIENLVQKCVDMHEEITMDSMAIHNVREGVSVDLRISLANNISIPLAVASLQKQIKQYLAASSGIEVKEVRVSVETTDGEAGEDGDFIVPAEEGATEKAAPKNGESKLPLHQRIFGKPEQPANMPEPPTAEEIAQEAEAVAEEAVEDTVLTAEENAPETEGAATEEIVEEAFPVETEEEQAASQDAIVNEETEREDEEDERHE